MKSYLFMGKADFMQDATVIPVSNIEAAADMVSSASELGTTEWAVAYEFHGDDLLTVDHYER